MRICGPCCTPTTGCGRKPGWNASPSRPAIYGSWTPTRFAAAVKALNLPGLETRQLKRTVDGREINRYGLTRDQLAAAIEATGPRREIE